MKSVSALFKTAKDQVEPFVHAANRWEREKALQGLGMNEGLYFTMRILELDANCDGKITEIEVAKFETLGKEMVSAYQQFFTNTGVVTALILSLIFPIAFELELTGAEASREYIMNIVAYVFLQVSVTCCMLVLVYSAIMHSQLSFFMPNIACQLWYLDRVRKWLVYFEVVKNATYIFLSISMICKATADSWFGFISLLPLLGTCFALLHLTGYVNPYVLNPYLQSYIKFVLFKEKHEEKSLRGNKEVVTQRGKNIQPM